MPSSGRSMFAPMPPRAAWGGPARLRSGAAAIAALGILGLAAGQAEGVSVSVSPTSLVLVAGDSGQLTLTNPGDGPQTYDLRMGNYEIRPDGRVVVDPRQPPSRSARDWLTVTPGSVSLEARGSTVLRIRSRRVRAAAPGDHHALVLITSRVRPRSGGRVGVRAQVGIGVIVRVPGGYRRRVSVSAPTAVTDGRRRSIRVRIANLGNVNERFDVGQIRLELLRDGRVVGRGVAAQRSILPGESGMVVIPHAGTAQGRLVARVTVRFARTSVAGPGITSVPAPIVRRADVRF